MRVTKYVMPAVAIVTLLGAVLVAKAVGAWQTSGRDMVDPTQPLTSADSFVRRRNRPARFSFSARPCS
ncbi:MAG: hypothetical protein AB8I80_09915 [Anaerolineae bacterium]